MEKIISFMWPKLDYKFIIVLFLLTSSASQLKGQVAEESQVSALVDRWTTYNETHQELRGYRIQILASTDRRQSESMRKKFEIMYPDYPILFVHNYPYYHLKVGAFMTMQKAQAFLYKMQQDYPQALTVSDNITMEELLNFDQ